MGLSKAIRKKKRELALFPIPLEWKYVIALANFTIMGMGGYGVASDMYLDVSRQGLIIRLIKHRQAWCEIGWEKRPGIWLNYLLVLQYMHISRQNVPKDYEQMIQYVLGPENLCVLERLTIIIDQNGFIELAKGISALQRNE